MMTTFSADMFKNLCNLSCLPGRLVHRSFSKDGSFGEGGSETEGSNAEGIRVSAVQDLSSGT